MAARSLGRTPAAPPRGRQLETGAPRRARAARRAGAGDGRRARWSRRRREAARIARAGRGAEHGRRPRHVPGPARERGLVGAATARAFPLTGVVTARRRVGAAGLGRAATSAPPTSCARRAATSWRRASCAAHGRAFLIATARVHARQERKRGAGRVLGAPIEPRRCSASPRRPATRSGLSDGRRLLRRRPARPAGAHLRPDRRARGRRRGRRWRDGRVGAARARWRLACWRRSRRRAPAPAPSSGGASSPRARHAAGGVGLAASAGGVPSGAAPPERRVSGAPPRTAERNAAAVGHAGPDTGAPARPASRGPRAPGPSRRCPPPADRPSNDGAPGGAGGDGRRAGRGGGGPPAPESRRHRRHAGPLPLIERIGEGGMAEIFIAAAHGAEGFVRTLRRQADAPAHGAQPRGRQPVHRRGAAAVGPGALEHRPRVRLRARRRGVLPGAGVHPRPRLGAAGAPARRGVRELARACRSPSTSCTRCWRRWPTRTRSTDAEGQPTGRSSIATSRRGTSWSRRAAR